MDKQRKDRILDVAIELAEAGGFDNVRQRDVADQAGIALGTLYKSFASKEHILSAALAREAAELEYKLKVKPPTGATAAERLQGLFKIMTRAMCHKPKYARAVLRAMASGQPEVAAHVTAYQGLMNGIIVSVMRNGSAEAQVLRADKLTDPDTKLATFLQQIWFASLVGWSAGILSQTEVIDHMREAIDLILHGGSRGKLRATAAS